MDTEATLSQHLMYLDVQQILARQFGVICKHWMCVPCVSCVSTSGTRQRFKVCRGRHFDWIFAMSLSCLSLAQCPASHNRPPNASLSSPHPSRTRHWPGWPCTFWTPGLVILHSKHGSNSYPQSTWRICHFFSGLHTWHSYLSWHNCNCSETTYLLSCT